MRSALVYTLLTALGFAGNLAYLLFLGSVFGAGREMDVLFASATVPQFFEILVLGSLGFALVPFLVGEREAGVERMWRAAGAATVASVFLFAALFVVGSALAHPIIRVTNPGFDAEQIRAGAQLSRIHWLSEVLMALRVCLTALLLARRRYALAGMAPLVGSIVALGILWALVGRLGVMAGALGLAASTLVQCLVMWPFGMRGWLFRKDWRMRLRPLWSQMGPLVAGAAYGRTDTLVDRFLLSFVPAGAITYLAFGNRLIVSLSALTVSGVSAVWLPEMARHSVREEIESLRKLFRRGIEALLLATLFIACLMPVFARDLLGLLFRRGQFTAEDVANLTNVVLALAGVYVAGTLGQLTANAFYAQRDTRTPAILNAVVYTLSIGLRLLGLKLFGFVGIAAAASAGSVLGVAAQFWALRRRYGLVRWRPLAKMGLVYGGTAAISVGIAAAAVHSAAPWARVVLGSSVAALLFAPAVSLVGGEIPRTARARLLSWLGRPPGPAGGVR